MEKRKRIQVRRETIRNLESDESRMIRGGDRWTEGHWSTPLMTCYTPAVTRADCHTQQPTCGTGHTINIWCTTGNISQFCRPV